MSSEGCGVLSHEGLQLSHISSVTSEVNTVLIVTSVETNRGLLSHCKFVKLILDAVEFSDHNVVFILDKLGEGVPGGRHLFTLLAPGRIVEHEDVLARVLNDTVPCLANNSVNLNLVRRLLL